LKPYSIAKIIWLYIKQYIQSGNEHSIHSPFVFKFYTQVIKAARKKDPRFAPIARFVQKLTHNKTQLTYTDPSTNQPKVQTIGYIAKNAAKPALLGRVLGLSLDYFKPAMALELGTSLGISALYQTIYLY
jgi:predicted helicase